MHNTYLIIKEIDKDILCSKREIDKDNPAEYCKYILSHIQRKPDIENRVIEHLLKYLPFLLYYENARTGDSIHKLIEYLNVLVQLKNELKFHQYPARQKDIETIQELFSYSYITVKKKSVVLSEKDFQHLENYILRKENRLTEKGIYFFLCLFLEKKHAFHLLTGSQELNNPEENLYRATLESFMIFCCKLPSYNIGHSNIALDILNELNHCPKELFKLLSAEDKMAFCVNDSLYAKHEKMSQTIMKRYNDRFSYFALRYFDHSKALNGITFHLQLGHRHKEEAHTKSVNSVIRTHNILKPMRTFNELSFYQHPDANNFFSQDEEIEYYAPKYRIVGNRIGLLLDMPQAHGYEVVKKNIPPHAILSTHELGALFFYNYLYKQGLIKTSPKQLISDYIANFNRFISDFQSGKIQPYPTKRTMVRRQNDIVSDAQKDYVQEKLNKYNLKVSYLPDACKEYLSACRIDTKEHQIREKLKKILYKARRQINNVSKIIERNADILNKKNIIDQLSKELARDIVQLTPPHEVDRKGIPHLQKIGNMEFEVLQRLLAGFPSGREELRTHFDILSVRDRGRKRWLHPFLYKFITYDMDQCSQLTDLYIHYFQRKERWLLGMIGFNLSDKKWSLLRSVWEISGQYNYFLKLNKIKPAIRKDYSKETILLPKGLFDMEIARAMKSAGYNVEEKDNSAYCLKIYYDGLSQHYYSLPRYYDGSIISEDWKTTEKNSLKQKINILWKNVDEDSQKKLKSLTKQIKENESQILNHQYKDRIMFMMANDLLPDAFKFRKEDIAHIGFNHPENVLTKPYTIRETIHGRPVVVKLPINKYGKFRHFMKDHRFKKLFKYFPVGKDIHLNEIICKEDLKDSMLYKELDTYYRKKKELLIQMHLFEQNICSRFKEKIEISGDYITHTDCLACAQKELNLSHYLHDIPSLEALTNMREEILCNQLPYEEWINEKIANENDDSTMLTEKILTIMINVYQNMNQSLIPETN